MIIVDSILSVFKTNVNKWIKTNSASPCEWFWADLQDIGEVDAKSMTDEDSALFVAITNEMSEKGIEMTLRRLKSAYLKCFYNLCEIKGETLEDEECKRLIETGDIFLQLLVNKAWEMGGDPNVINSILGKQPQGAGGIDHRGVNSLRGKTDTQVPRQEHPQNSGNLKKTLQDLLPEKLRSDEALKIFQRAIDANMIEKTATGVKWMQIGTKGGKAQLAYFCGKFCGYKNGLLVNGYRGNVGNRVCYDVFEKLFNVNRLDRALAQCYEASKPQWWRDKIDALFH